MLYDSSFQSVIVAGRQPKGSVFDDLTMRPKQEVFFLALWC